jgi:hypothetical protein
MAVKRKTRRKRRSSIEVGIATVMREARKEKLAFEKRLSGMLSEALDMDVVVKIKPKAVSTAVAKAKRQPAVKNKQYIEDLEELFDRSQGTGAREQLVLLGKDADHLKLLRRQV